MKKSLIVVLLMITTNVTIAQIGISNTKDKLSQEAYTNIAQANKKMTLAAKNIDKNFNDVKTLIKQELDELSNFSWELKREELSINNFITTKSATFIKERYQTIDRKTGTVSYSSAEAMTYDLFKLKKEKENIKMYLSLENKGTEEAKRILLVLGSIEKVIKTTIQ